MRYLSLERSLLREVSEWVRGEISLEGGEEGGERREEGGGRREEGRRRKEEEKETRGDRITRTPYLGYGE